MSPLAAGSVVEEPLRLGHRITGYKPSSWASPLDHDRDDDDDSNNDDETSPGGEDAAGGFIPQPVHSSDASSIADRSSHQSRASDVTAASITKKPGEDTTHTQIDLSMDARNTGEVAGVSPTGGPNYLQIAQFQNAAQGFLSPAASAVLPSHAGLSPPVDIPPTDSGSTGPATPVGPFDAASMDALCVAGPIGTAAAANSAVLSKQVDLISGITHYGDSPGQLAENYFGPNWPPQPNAAFSLPPPALQDLSRIGSSQVQPAGAGGSIAAAAGAGVSVVAANVSYGGPGTSDLHVQGQTLALALLKEHAPDAALEIARAAVRLLQNHTAAGAGPVGAGMSGGPSGSNQSDPGSPSHDLETELKVGSSGLPSVKLVHPDEFKNPSTFLKIYGDPLCFTKNGPLPKKGKNGNWECSKCGNVNFPRRFRCNLCGTTRDEEGDKIVCDYARQVYERYIYVFRSHQPRQSDPPAPSAVCPAGVTNSTSSVSNQAILHATASNQAILHATGATGHVQHRHNHHGYTGGIHQSHQQHGRATQSHAVSAGSPPPQVPGLQQQQRVQTPLPGHVGLGGPYAMRAAGYSIRPQATAASFAMEPPLWTTDPAVLGGSPATRPQLNGHVPHDVKGGYTYGGVRGGARVIPGGGYGLQLPSCLPPQAFGRGISAQQQEMFGGIF